MKLIIEIDETIYNALNRVGHYFIPNSDDLEGRAYHAIANGTPYNPTGDCRTCRHRDPEDKKCDCGALERQGCPFPVSDDYFCKFYEKGGAE